MVKFKLFLIIFTVISIFSSVAKATCPEVPRDCFTFDENGQVHTDSGAAEKTFNWPPMKIGFLVDFNYKDILPDWTIQIPHTEIDLPYGQALALNAGVATSRAFISLDYEAIAIIRMGPTIWCGYNFLQEDIAWGVGFSILDF